MDLLMDSLYTAVQLILSGNQDVLEVALRTITISITSTFISSLIFVPVGGFISFYHFRGKNLIITIINTLFGTPTVFIGLITFILLSKQGPMGQFNLLFSPAAIIIGHVLLISPIITGLTISTLNSVPRQITDTAKSLGANRSQIILITLKQAKYGVYAAILMGFGRAFSEIGLAIMVGGNIRGYTRTLTTAMSLETSVGNFELAMALGIILVSLSLSVNIIVGILQRR